MRLQKISSAEDVEIVKCFFHDIFWEVSESVLVYFEKSVTGKHTLQRLEYYLGYENDIAVGISGIYAANPDECWLGWFGIRPEYRRKGYATVMLNLQLDIMKNYGYKVCRLYTDYVINKAAIPLYIKAGFIKDSDYINHIMTMSKSLDNVTEAPKWHGKPLGFA